MTIEEISNHAMEVISYSGMAKSTYIEALRELKQKNLNKFDEKINEADSYFAKAHKAHFSVLAEEMNTGEAQITMLMAHALDQLLCTETIKTLIIEFKEILFTEE